jgi:VIT1/CCC1 family predicted Fe2+/Mn2+ transporter
LSVLITVSPMFFGLSGFLEYTTSLYLSVLVGFVLLAALGAFLGRVSRQGIASFTVKTILAGLLTMLVMAIVTISTGV